MLLNGKKISGPNTEIIVLPRGEEELVFTAQAVLDMEDFDNLYPRPVPPTLRRRNGESYQDIEDSKFKERLNDWGEKRMDFIFLKSLEATEALEWETVDFSDPETWGNYREELTDSGFSEIEIQRLMLGVMNANCLNEARLEEARRSFLASNRNPALNQQHQAAGQNGTLSGEHAKDSA